MKKENEKSKPVSSGENKLMNEKELDSVSGGLLGITIWDRCKSAWDESICAKAFFGKCPHLVVVEKGAFSREDTREVGTRYSASCGKGFFSNAEYEISRIF